jgi:DNA-binding NarL/FixJ family response regulator
MPLTAVLSLAVMQVAVFLSKLVSPANALRASMTRVDTVLIADDHAVVREGLRNLLVRAGYAVVAEVSTGEDAVLAWREHRPALVLLDVGMPGQGGLEALIRIRADDRDACVLVFTMHEDLLHASRALKAGARGYFPKSGSPDALLAAITCVQAGGTFVPAEFEAALKKPPRPSELGDVGALTRREFEVFRRLVHDEALQDIANALGISYQSVANVQTQIRQKLDATSLTELKRIAIQHGLLS